MSPVAAARLLTIALAALVFAVGCVELARIWREVPTNVRLIRLVVRGTAFTAGYGSLEAFLQDAPGGTRNLLVPLVLFLALLAYLLPDSRQMVPWRRRRRRRGHQHPVTPNHHHDRKD